MKRSRVRHAKTSDCIKFLCKLCKKIFLHKNYLDEHVKSVHRNVVPDKQTASPSIFVRTDLWTRDKVNDKLYVKRSDHLENVGLYLNGRVKGIVPDYIWMTVIVGGETYGGGEV